MHDNNFVPFETKGFTFGFEVEGVFNKDLRDLLTAGGTFKGDGSVHIDACPIAEDKRILCDTSDSETAREYASPIFKSLDRAVEQLKLFTAPNYHSNKTCGVHFHIGYKVKNALFNKFQDEPICQQLQRQFMPLMCKCVKERVSGEQAHWCMLHDNYYRGFATTDKYRAVHFHTSYNTIELRLFAPCRHLMNNLRAVLTEFYRVGYRDYSHDSETICGLFSKDGKTEISEVVTVERPSYSYGFNKDREFAISPLAMRADFKEYEELQRDIGYYNIENYRRFRNGNILRPLSETV
jgi:hypothetical protein